MQLKLHMITETVGGVLMVKFRDDNLTTFNIRITDEGRVVSVVHGHRTLHSWKRVTTNRAYRLPRDKLKRCKELACAAVAADALGVDEYPPQEIDL